MKKIRIYIVGAITGKPVDETNNKFQQWEDKLNAIGYEAVNPLKLGIPRDHNFKQSSEKNYAAIDTCEGLLVLSDWYDSEGSPQEIIYAKTKGKSVFYVEENGFEDLAALVPLEDIEA